MECLKCGSKNLEHFDPNVYICLDCGQLAGDVKCNTPAELIKNLNVYAGFAKQKNPTSIALPTETFQATVQLLVTLDTILCNLGATCSMILEECSCRSGGFDGGEFAEQPCEKCDAVRKIIASGRG